MRKLFLQSIFLISFFLAAHTAFGFRWQDDSRKKYRGQTINELLENPNIQNRAALQHLRDNIHDYRLLYAMMHYAGELSPENPNGGWQYTNAEALRARLQRGVSQAISAAVAAEARAKKQKRNEQPQNYAGFRNGFLNQPQRQRNQNFAEIRRDLLEPPEINNHQEL